MPELSPDAEDHGRIGHTVEAGPLHNKYADLFKEASVQQAAAVHERKTDERLPDPADKIGAYLGRLEALHMGPGGEGQDPRVMDRLKHAYHDAFVMQPEHVPEAYFELQKRIARERGHGDVEIQPAARREMAETITRDQERSLDRWVDYLASSDAAYPMWFKYYAFRNVVKMADYDKGKGEFKKRSKSTTSPFPDLDREALSYVSDAMTKHYAIKDKRQAGAPADIEPKTKALLDNDANFAKLYAQAIEYVQPATAEQLAVTDGEWVKFAQGSDGKVLAETLQGHGTGWCTAGEGTAQSQLDGGDFHVYYSKDADGAYTVPRVAIRMKYDQIAEVRGIQANQNLEPELVQVAQDKMNELPGADEYLKKSADMERLTAIDRATTAGRELTIDDLSFLYEANGKIQGFGYEADPRIAELKAGRDVRADYAQILNLPADDINVSTLVAAERQGLNRDEIENTSLNDKVAWILVRRGFGPDIVDLLDNFPSINRTELANFLIDDRNGYAVVDNIDKFTGINRTEFANRLIDAGEGFVVASNLKKFTNLKHDELANRLLDAGNFNAVASNLHNFSGIKLDIDFANRLIDGRREAILACNLEKFTGVDHVKLANRLIDRDESYAIAENLDKFTGVNHVELANRLIDDGEPYVVAYNLDKFTELDQATLDRLKQYQSHL